MENCKRKKFSQSKLLQLNNSKAKKILKWSAKLNLNQTIKFLVDWYKHFKKNKNLTYKISLDQIKLFQKKKLIMTKVVILAGGLGTRLSEYTKNTKAYG